MVDQYSSTNIDRIPMNDGKDSTVQLELILPKRNCANKPHKEEEKQAVPTVHQPCIM